MGHVVLQMVLQSEGGSNCVGARRLSHETLCNRSLLRLLRQLSLVLALLLAILTQTVLVLDNLNKPPCVGLLNARLQFEQRGWHSNP